MIRSIGILVVLSLASNFVFAEFVLTYPKDAAERKQMKNSVLLYNNAATHLVENGEGMADTIPASVNRMLITDALSMLVPTGWQVYGSDVDLKDKFLNLNEGEPWTESFRRAGQDHDLIFSVDWDKKRIIASKFTEKGLYDDTTSKPLDESVVGFDGPKKLHLKSGDLRESLEIFSMVNNLVFKTDTYEVDRHLKVHPTVAEYTHPIPSCITWTLSNSYNTETAEWLTELNRIMKPYRLKVFLFSNNVLFLTSLHKYGNDFCNDRDEQEGINDE